MLGFCSGASLSSISTWNVLSGFSVSLAPILWFADARPIPALVGIFICVGSICVPLFMGRPGSALKKVIQLRSLAMLDQIGALRVSNGPPGSWPVRSQLDVKRPTRLRAGIGSWPAAVEAAG